MIGDKRAGNRFILNWSLDLVMSALLFVHLECIVMRALPVQCQKNLRMRIRTPMVQASNLVHDTSSEHSESQEVVRSSDYQARNIPQQGKIKKSLEQRNQTHQPCLRENQGTVLLRRVERLNTNMHEACLKIDKECRVLTVHGSDDAFLIVMPKNMRSSQNKEDVNIDWTK
ncbi:hypothetical protein Bca52824_011529 [Brassica carinata]|uniref:Uncharacterized protein n=1 Tax=Brassica carinata TaxID=52824 RepID=A0A8X7WEX3_BRACI|nr:hypothetical protein Bca52824_011529 [Brassica carinata]